MVQMRIGLTELRKFKQTFRGRKLMATVVWDRKGVLLVAFLNPGATIASEVYSETLNSYGSWFKSDGVAF